VPPDHAHPVSAAAHDSHVEALPLSALAGMLLAASLAPLGSTMMAVALPSIGQDIGADASALTPWLVSSYLIASIALQSPGGKLGDRVGHGRALVAGLSLVAIGGLLGLAGSSLRTLGAARILMAAGGAATVPATVAILRNRTAADRRARMFGVFGACMGLAAAVGPLIGGELTHRFGWRAVFAANLPVIALSFLLVTRSRGTFARESAGQPSFDWLGSALLASGLTLAIVALRMPEGARLWPGAIAAVALAVFSWWERRAASPVIDFSLFKRAAFFGGASIVALQNMAMYPLVFQLPLFFDGARGLGPRTMGYALLALTLAMVATSLVGGRLADRIGARTQAFAGSLVALAGLWWFADFESVRTPSDLVPGMLLMGAGIGMTSPPAQAASMSTVGRDQAGMAGGVTSTMRYLGGVAGATAMSALLSDPASPASHQRPVVVYAGALVAAAVLSALLPPAAQGERR
jgi:MFS family permease